MPTQPIQISDYSAEFDVVESLFVPDEDSFYWFSWIQLLLQDLRKIVLVRRADPDSTQ